YICLQNLEYEKTTGLYPYTDFLSVLFFVINCIPPYSMALPKTGRVPCAQKKRGHFERFSGSLQLYTFQSNTFYRQQKAPHRSSYNFCCKPSKYVRSE